MTLQNTQPEPSLLTLDKRPGAYAQLFCFPHAGAGASIFSNWSRRLHAGIELSALCIAGREARAGEPAPRRLDEIADSAVRAIERASPSFPVLYGHSFGALVAFFVAQTLERRNHPVRHLIVSGAAAPDQARQLPPIHRLPDAEFVGELITRYDGIPEALLHDRELLAYFLPALRADLRVLETYDPTTALPLSCPITALAGSDDPLASPSAMERWRPLSRKSFCLHAFQGGHFFVRERPEEVLQAIDNIVSESYFREVRSA